MPETTGVFSSKCICFFRRYVEELITIYISANAKFAEEVLNEFRSKWEEKYPTIVEFHEINWQGDDVFFVVSGL